MFVCVALCYLSQLVFVSLCFPFVCVCVHVVALCPFVWLLVDPCLLAVIIRLVMTMDTAGADEWERLCGDTGSGGIFGGHRHT